MINAGDFVAGATVPIPFNTFDSNGESVTVTELVAADVHIHKDAGTTQRTSAAGVTVSIDFDGITGNHLITIDTSDDTDAGFYAPGSDYAVRLEGITVNAQTLNVWIGMYSIENRFMRGTDSAALASVCTEGRLAELDAGNLPTDMATLLTAIQAVMTTQMTEAYAADGVAPTPAQALMLIQQVLTEFAIVATALTIKKLDGSTPAAVLTLDDPVNPTAATRTS